MTRTYTPEQEEWLRLNYHSGTINDTLDAFEREFGRRPSKQALFVKANKMGLRKDVHGEERYVPAQKRMRWSSPEFEREREWMLANDRNQSVYQTIDTFEEEFGVRLNRAQVSLFRSSHGTQKRLSHGGGKPLQPVGSERLGKDGYVMVKVKEYPDVPQSKDNWRFKHHVAWEEANGEQLPRGWVVLFADHDTRNFDSGNLVAIPRKYVGRLNCGPRYYDRESLLACIALVDLERAVVEAKNHPRPCMACGALFKPARWQRYQKTNTCPECLAQGRKSYERHGAAGEARCAVCERAFVRNRKNQRRCAECIAEKPNHSVERHRSIRNQEGK